MNEKAQLLLDFFDSLSPGGAKGPPGALCALRAPAAPPSGARARAAKHAA